MSRALDEGHLAAQPAHGLSHLDTDRPTADDQQAARDGLHAGHLAVGPDTVQLAQARDRRHDRIRAGRQHHMRRRVTPAVDLDHAGPAQAPGAADQVDALARQPGLLPGVGVVRDHEVAIGQRARDIHSRGGSHLPRLTHRLAGAQQRLGRDARPVRALAADQLPLYQRHP